MTDRSHTINIQNGKMDTKHAMCAVCLVTKNMIIKGKKKIKFDIVIPFPCGQFMHVTFIKGMS